jgi:hypothetical protein
MKDRILEFRRIPAAQLRANPRNWRTHPPAQRAALRGILAEVGYVDALIARRLPDGSFELIDGHLRAETTPDGDVPVLVVDLDETEANKVLATLDPLAAMAETDAQQLRRVLCDVSTGDEHVAALLQDLQRVAEGTGELDISRRDIPIPECYRVIVECDDEQQQQDVYERLAAEGYDCRLLVV